MNPLALISLFKSLAPAVKIGVVAASTLVVNIVAFGTQFAAEVLAQTDSVGASPDTIVQAASLTGTAGALAYVVRQIASGRLVHRDPAVATQQMQDALKRVEALLEQAHAREKTYHDLIVSRLREGG